MLPSLELPTLEAHRREQILVLFYKIVNEIACIQTARILTRANHRFKSAHDRVHYELFRHNFSLEQPPAWHSGSWNYGWGIKLEVSFISGLTIGAISVIPTIGSYWLFIRISNHFYCMGPKKIELKYEFRLNVSIVICMQKYFYKYLFYRIANKNVESCSLFSF